MRRNGHRMEQYAILSWSNIINLGITDENIKKKKNNENNR